MQKLKVVAIFSQRLQRAMEEAGLDGVRLAERIGVKQASVSKWTTGKSLPQAENLERLAATLGRPVAWFFEQAALARSPEERTELEGVLREIKAVGQHLGFG